MIDFIKGIVKMLLLPAYLYQVSKIKNEQDIDKLLDFVYNRCFRQISPAQKREEVKALMLQVKKLQPKYIMEIGSLDGGTLFLFLKMAAPDAKIISVDLPYGMYGGGYPHWKSVVYKAFVSKMQKLFLVRADSHKEETLKKVKDILGDNNLDFIFIDGDHTYEGVKQDFKMYGPLVRLAGGIAFHDIATHSGALKCGVDIFWNEIKNNYEYKEFIYDENSKWAGIGFFIKK